MEKLLRIVIVAVTVWTIVDSLDVPWVMMYKRFMFLQTWDAAAFMQRVSMNYYTDYRQEIDS